MLKKEYQIIVPFVKFPWRKYTFKDIKKLTNKTSDDYVYKILKKYTQENILSSEKVGKSILYSANLSEQKTITYFGFISEYLAWNSKQLPFKFINKIIKKIPTYFFIFVITGSYAKNKQKETSDLDIVIIIDDTEKSKKVLAEINYTCELSIPKGHPYVFKKSEFLEMLLNDEANYGKEIALNNLIICSGSSYFQIMYEAIKNGFNDKKLS